MSQKDYEPLYAERDLMELDKKGNHYCKHVGAMTREQLHSKSDIAAELAYRDVQIDELAGALIKLLDTGLTVSGSQGVEAWREAKDVASKYRDGRSHYLAGKALEGVKK